MLELMDAYLSSKDIAPEGLVVVMLVAIGIEAACVRNEKARMMSKRFVCYEKDQKESRCRCNHASSHFHFQKLTASLPSIHRPQHPKLWRPTANWNIGMRGKRLRRRRPICGCVSSVPLTGRVYSLFSLVSYGRLMKVYCRCVVYCRTHKQMQLKFMAYSPSSLPLRLTFPRILFFPPYPQICSRNGAMRVDR